MFLCEDAYLSVPLVEVYDSMCATREALEEERDRLEKIVRGQVVVEEAADNAAVWYLRAIDLLERIEPAELEALGAVEAGALVTLDDEISATLREADDVVELFRRGASIRRCDFSFLRETGPAFVPAYLPGMNDGLRFLHLDVIRLLGVGRGAEGADRLALAFRVAVHLSGDESILSPLIAHTWFNHTFALAKEAAGNGFVSDEHRQVLAEAVDGMSRKDPFGYVGSARAGRSLASRRWLRQIPEREREMREAIEYRIQHGSGDDLAFWLAAIDAVERCETGAEGPQPDVSRLGDVLSLPALIELRRCVLSATTQEQCIELKLLEYDDSDHPAITSIADRSPQARADLRACLAFLADGLAGDAVGDE
jgi:hypothetical protein